MTRRQLKRKRAGKEDWLAIALEMLATDGIAGVQVERMARRLGISKSGFYWHFRDRKDLLRQLLDYWAHEYTEVVTSNPTLREGEPSERLLNAMNMVLDHDLDKFEVSMRAWAEDDPVVAAKVEEVYRRRLRFIRSILADIGFKGEELDVRTRIIVCYLTWDRAMFRRESQAKRRHMRKRLQAILTGGA